MPGIRPQPRLILRRLRLGDRLRVAPGARLGRRVRLEIAPGAWLVLGTGCSVGDGTRINVTSGTVEIGAGARLGKRCVITARDRVTIGAHACLGDEVVLIDFDHGIDDVEQPIRVQRLPTAPIAIGDRARVDHGTAVLRGVTVGAGAHVGTRSVVVRDVAAGAQALGIPAHAPRGPSPPRPSPAPRA